VPADSLLNHSTNYGGTSAIEIKIRWIS